MKNGVTERLRVMSNGQRDDVSERMMEGFSLMAGRESMPGAIGKILDHGRGSSKLPPCKDTSVNGFSAA